MSGKLLWTGATLLFAVSRLWVGESVNLEFIGAFVMTAGAVLMWIGK